MLNCLKNKKLILNLALTSSLMLAVPVFAHADDGSGFSGFFKHLFGHHQKSLENNSVPAAQQSDISQANSNPQLMQQIPDPSTLSKPVGIIAPSQNPSQTPSMNSAGISPTNSPLNSSLNSSSNSSSNSSGNSGGRSFVALSGAVAPITAPTPSAPAYDACAPMKDGESRTVSPATVPQDIRALGAQYVLNKSTDSVTGKSVYEAVLNINFVPKSGEDSSVSETMADKTKTCYAAADIVADSGDHLKFRLAQPGETVPVTTVNVTAQKMAREDSMDWSTQTVCSVMIHESLHLLGVVDLYKETTIRDGAGQVEYDCRSTAPESIMADLGYAKYSADVFEETSCSCETNLCASALNKLSGIPDACPSAADTSLLTLTTGQLDLDTDPVGKALFMQQYSDEFQGVRKDQWQYRFIKTVKLDKQMLYPAEFRYITQAGCSTTTSLYAQCSKNAYLTSSAHAGSGCVTNTPSACSDPSVWLQ